MSASHKTLSLSLFFAVALSACSGGDGKETTHFPKQ